MKLTTIHIDGEAQSAIVHKGKQILISTINILADKKWHTTVFQIIQNGELKEIIEWYNRERVQLSNFPSVEVDAGKEPLYRHPEKIIGVGMNYLEKAIELSGKAKQTDPVFFLKPNSSLIGPEEAIKLPDQSADVTAEAELAIIIGKTCKNIRKEEASSVIAGFTPTLDMTAKDIHAKDPRFLQRSKSFDTFFSLGSTLHTLDEYEDWKDIAVETVKDGKVSHRNKVGNMIYSIPFIVSFFSEIMTLKAGDIIMTGTPGSVSIQPNNQVSCRITGFEPLENLVSKESVALKV